MPIEEIRAKEGNLTIPLYVVGEGTVVREGAAEYRPNGLREAVSAWLQSSATLRPSLEAHLTPGK